MELISVKTLANFFGSSLCFAVSLMPYIGIPMAANNAKYCAKEITNCTLPIPTGPKICDAYGKLSIGNKIFTTESNKL